MLKIEEFAEHYLGIKLLPIQIKMIESVADGKTLKFPTKTGMETATRVMREYLKHSLTEAVVVSPVTNKHGQPIGDFPKDIPSQADFDKFHHVPREYGEEGENLVISKSVSQDDAFKMIVQVMKEYGSDDAQLPKEPGDLSTLDIGYGYDHDSYHYSEGGYWICSDENQVSKRWEAWGWATQ